MENRAYWENLGQTYELEWRSPARKALAEKELAFVNRQLARTAAIDVLDVGIGSGRIVENYITATNARNIYGIDIADTMVQLCRRRYGAVDRVKDLQICDISGDPLPFGKEFNFISAIRVIKYNANWRAIIKKLVGYLAPDGLLVFTMPNDRSLSRFSRQSDVKWYKSSKPEIERLVGEMDARICQLAGFTRLPASLYTRSDIRLYSRSLLGLEAGLEAALGRALLARELFVAVRG
jgi:SAM-dependent methyltransferase